MFAYGVLASRQFKSCCYYGDGNTLSWCQLTSMFEVGFTYIFNDLQTQIFIKIVWSSEAQHERVRFCANFNALFESNLYVYMSFKTCSSVACAANQYFLLKLNTTSFRLLLTPQVSFVCTDNKTFFGVKIPALTS